jgi:cytochrome c oxidase assembly protein subunit 15
VAETLSQITTAGGGRATAGAAVRWDLVTAAGPHTGDAETPRLAVDIELLAQVHAGLLYEPYLLLGIDTGGVRAARALVEPAAVARGVRLRRATTGR